MGNNLSVWIFQTGEPLHIDENSPRPMRAMNLANALNAKGHKVILWSSAFYHQEKKHRCNNYKTIQVSDLLEIRLIPSPGYQGNIGLGRLWDHAILAKNLKKQLVKETDLPDVAFIGYPPIESAAIMTRFLKSNNIPSILDIKDQWPNIFLKIFPQSLQPVGRVLFSPYFYLAKRAMKDATHLSAIAKGFLEWSVQFSERSSDDNNMVIPLTTPNASLSKDEIDQARQWWNDKNLLKKDIPYIFFVGSHSPAFDFSAVFDAAKELDANGINCEFIICGHGDKTSNLKKNARNLTNVHFPGWVNKSQIMVLAEHSIASLAPYHNTEDFMMSIPNKVIDSLSLGLPILSPLKGEVKSLITNNNIGLFYGNGSNSSLYNSIKYLLDNKKERLKMSQNAHALYQDKFSYEVVYGSLVTKIEEMSFKNDQSSNK